MSLFKIRPGIEPDFKADKQNLNPVLPEEAKIHVLCAAIAADYVKFIKQRVLTNLDMPKKYTIRDLQVLTDVFESSATLTSAEIVKNSGLDPATVARSVKTLKTHGHMETAQNQEDSRSLLLTLTSEGQMLAESYIEACLVAFRDNGLGGKSGDNREISTLYKILKDFSILSRRLKKT